METLSRPVARQITSFKLTRTYLVGPNKGQTFKTSTPKYYDQYAKFTRVKIIVFRDEWEQMKAHLDSLELVEGVHWTGGAGGGGLIIRVAKGDK